MGAPLLVHASDFGGQRREGAALDFVLLGVPVLELEVDHRLCGIDDQARSLEPHR